MKRLTINRALFYIFMQGMHIVLPVRAEVSRPFTLYDSKELIYLLIDNRTYDHKIRYIVIESHASVVNPPFQSKRPQNICSIL